MIVPMHKAFIVARAAQRDRLLDALGALGVVHLTPVAPQQAAPQERTLAEVARLQTALARLRTLTATGAPPGLAPLEAAEEVARLVRQAAEKNERLTSLHQQAQRLALWGNVRLEQFQSLAQAGLDVRFYAVPPARLGELQAPCVQPLGTLADKRRLVAVVARGEPAPTPDGAELIALPPRDRASILAEAAQIDRQLQQDAQRLTQLAHLTPALEKELARLEAQAEITVATRGGLAADPLYALQGWVPAEKAPGIAPALQEQGLPAAVVCREPSDEDRPPTLIRAPRWCGPIEGLFRILGTVAGYREFDVSVAFMIALPIFSAILIGDAGYGAVLLLGPLLRWRKVTGLLGEQFTKLLMVIGGATIVWGCLSASFFGYAPYQSVIPVNMTDQSRFLMMNISFTIGSVHLSLAQLWQAARLFPSPAALSKLGWALFLWGMYGVVRMFVLGAPLSFRTPWPYCLIVGAALAILFAVPSRNVVKMVLLGLANFPLALLSTFSDTISYVRLMAVGLAGSVLAGSFNQLALAAGTLLITVPALVFGHGLNLGLALIALFSHGVRLNMLEFSNNLGMQWAGYTYKPFTRRVNQEIES